MTYTAPTTHVAGETLPAADYNVIVNDIIDHETRINNQPPLASARVGLTANLAYTSNADIAWDSSASVQSGHNVGSMWSSGTNPARLTIQTAGIYLVVFNYAATFTGTATQHSPYIYANGNAILADNTTANYATQYINVTGSSVAGGRATGQTVGEIVDIKNVNANQELTFFQPFATELTYVTSNGNWEAATPILQQRYSGFNATTSFTGFSIIPTSGNITGTLTVYGLAD
jgi:hypothetical protein